MAKGVWGSGTWSCKTAKKSLNSPRTRQALRLDLGFAMVEGGLGLVLGTTRFPVAALV